MRLNEFICKLNEFICKSCRKTVSCLNFFMSSCYGIHWSLITECLQSMHEMSVTIVDFDSSLIQNHSANAHGSPEDTSADNSQQSQAGACCRSQAVPVCSCGPSVHCMQLLPCHCSWLQGKFSARLGTWWSMPREPPHWWNTKSSVTWQGEFGVQ